MICQNYYEDKIIVFHNLILISIYNLDIMEALLEGILKSAMDRKPQRLSFDSTYNHKNIKDWLQSILPGWNIVFPNVENVSTELEGPCALSEWPTEGDCRNGVKKYLEDQNYKDPDDLIDGACEPLAFYLSKYIRNEKLENFNMVIDTHHLFRFQREAKQILDMLPPDISAPRIFANYLRQGVLSPKFWEDVRTKSKKLLHERGKNVTWV